MDAQKDKSVEGFVDGTKKGRKKERKEGTNEARKLAQGKIYKAKPMVA